VKAVCRTAARNLHRLAYACRWDLRARHYDTNSHRCFGPERALISPNACTPARFKNTENLRRRTSRKGPDLHIRCHQAQLRLGGVSASRERHLPCSPRSLLSWTGANAARQVFRDRPRGGAARPRRTRASHTVCVPRPAAARGRLWRGRPQGRRRSDSAAWAAGAAASCSQLQELLLRERQIVEPSSNPTLCVSGGDSAGRFGKRPDYRSKVSASWRST
jgi:hypothetical protein